MDLNQKAALLSSFSICKVFESLHQNDTAWVATEDDTPKNYEEHYRKPAAKVIGMAVLTWWDKLKKEKQTLIPVQQLVSAQLQESLRPKNQ